MQVGRHLLLQEIADLVAGTGLRLKQPYDTHVDFADLGIDSLGVVELMASVELKYGLMIDDADYRRIRTADDFATYLLVRLG